MSKDRTFRQKRNKASIRKIGAAVVATMLVVVMAVGLIPSNTGVLAADKTTNIEGFSATLIADPHTSEDDHIFNGTPAEDGKIWTDKSVTTGAMYGLTAGEDNFTVALSALAQTYNTVTTGMTAEQQNVAYDVVFVLDFSGSMNDRTGSSNSSPRKGAAMVDALNPAIATLMENANTRIAVVGYAGSNVNTSSAQTLLDLNHYTTTTQEDGNNIYFEYTTSGGSRVIRTVDGVSNGTTEVSASKVVNGGTPTQRGIYRAMDLLQNEAKPNDNVTRIPIIVLLTDGEAGSARANYRTLSGGTLYEGSANNSSSNNNDEVGAYTALTANYAKTTIDTLYKSRYNYTNIIASGESAAKFYTIGLGIDDDSWTRFMLDPDYQTTDTTANNMKTILAADATYGSNYAYSDAYYGGENMSADDLNNAFAGIVADLQVQPQISSTVNDPVTTETTSVTGANVTFTDWLGYKMELKGDSQYLRYRGVNYRFDKQDDNTYVFSGYDQDGNAVTGPAITKGDKAYTYTLADVTFKAEYMSGADATYNGQTGYWKITWSFPGALLPTYSRLTDYDNTDLEPIRMLYEVGLSEDVNLWTDGLKIDADGNLLDANATTFDKYVFHTNLYDYEKPQAMTWSEYTPAKDNPYYYETGYVTSKTGAGYDEDEDVAEYIRLDMIAVGTKMGEIEGTANVVLSDINVSLSNARATFVYGGTTYRVDLTGDSQDGAVWSGEVSVPVVGQTADGQEISVNVAVRIEATYDDGFLFFNDLDLSKVTIRGQEATISNSTATLNGLTISVWGEVPDQTTEEVVSVYMELKEDNDGYYVEDVKGNRIDVEKDSTGVYKVTLENKTYYSDVYYKYKEGTVSYVDKQLGKGTIARSLVGQFKINQPSDENFDLAAAYEADSNIIEKMFQYYPSNYDEAKKIYNATRVIIDNGDDANRVVLGEPLEETVSTVDGTINVCVDGILNGEDDVNGNPMKIHFNFILEEQTLENGRKKYVLLDCNYWDTDDIYSVDVVASDTPDIDATNNVHSYDISYTIESTNPASNETIGNITQTDPHFFHSHLEGGQMKARLGNNGRISVNLSDAYEKNVTVQKEWYDRLGNKLDNSITALQNVSITAGIYQVYSYVDDNNETQSQSGTNGVPFATAELNQENGFTYTWTTPYLPKYLVDDGGDYVLDKDDNKVPVTYIAGEVTGADGWTLSEVVDNSTDSEDIYTLQNVPLAEFSPTVQKVWTNTATGEAPEGYKVKIELLANDEPVTTANKIDTEHVITATLEQTNANANATLHVDFGGVALGSQSVHIVDFGDENTTKAYEFEYAGEDGNGFGGAAGSGTHADTVTVTIMVSNTSGDKLSVADVTVTYNYKDTVTGKDKGATLDAFRTNSATDGNVKTYTYVMYYSTTEKAEVILDGVVDSAETQAWYSELNKWNLPMLKKDDNGNYTAIKYSIRETVYVPDDEGTVTLSETDTQKYKAYTPDKNGLIIIPLADGGERVFKASITHTEDYHFTVTNQEGLTSVTAEKVWVDNNNAYNTRPANIQFQLKADGVVVDEYTKTIVSTGETADVWNGTANVEWNDIPLYDTTTGKAIVYTVDEVINYASGQTDKYKVSVTVDSENANHFVVTNSLHADPAINYTSMDVEKVWVDNNNAYTTRPENLYMVLYRTLDGSTEAEVVPGAAIVTLNGNNSWKDTTTWVNLAKYSTDGKLYTYSVKEYTSLTRSVEGVSGYELISTDVSNNGTKYTFTNQLADGAISKTVTKVWKDAALEEQRPESVEVVLSASVDGTSLDLTKYVSSDKTSTQEVDYQPTQILGSASWSFTWNNLPEYNNGKKIDYTIAETKVGDVSVAVDATSVTVGDATYTITTQDDGNSNEFVVTNRLTGETSVTVTKEWDVTQAPSGYTIPTVKFDVYNRFHGKLDGKILEVANGGSDTISGLPKYNADGAAYVYTVEEQPIANDGTYVIESVIGNNESTDGNFVYTATNTYVPLIQDISGTKTWVGVTGDNIPESITVELYRQYGDGAAELVTDANNYALQPTWSKSADEKVWTYTYEDLRIYEDDNTSKPYTYSIKEASIKQTADSNPIEVVEEDGKRVAGDYTVIETGLNITNELGGTVDGETLAGTKTWVDVKEENVPDSIKVQLMRSSSAVALQPALDTEGKEVEITVKKADQSNVLVWTYNFANVTLPKYDADGNAYVYSVKEVNVKVGSTTRTVTYSDATLTSGIVGDYTVTISGRDIKNTLKSDNAKDKTVEFPMTKEWVYGNAYSIPSSGIKVEITGTGAGTIKEEVTLTTANVTVDAANSNIWHYTFKNLRKYTDNGITEYVYSIEETEVGGVAVAEDSEGVLKAGEWTVTMPDQDTIINSRDVLIYDITVEKEWDGVTGNNVPDSIQVQLYQNGVEFGVPTTLTKDNNWSYTFTGLPRSSDGSTLFKYEVKELSVTADGVTEVVVREDSKVTVGDYKVSEPDAITELKENEILTITNTLNTGNNKVKVDYPVTKVWEDVTDTSNYSVQVQLLQNGETMTGDAYEKTLSSNAWKTTFIGLDKYTANGITQHVYTAKETKIGIKVGEEVVYTSVNNGKAGDFFVTYTQQDKAGTIINNRLATVNVDKELIDYPVNKSWKDEEGNALTDNLPTSITIQLMQGTATYGSEYTFTAEDIADDWTHTFTDLRKYEDDGLTPYEYSAVETKVGNVAVSNDKAGAWKAEYDVSGTKTTITNMRTEVRTDIKVTKTWVDVTGANIPDAIVVELHGGADIESVTLKKADATGDKTVWTYTFTNLPVYRADGITKYNYTIKEASVTADGTTASVIYTNSTNGTVGDYTVVLGGSMDDKDGFTITNTLKQGTDKDLTVNYTVTKRWHVPTGAALPNDVTVDLYRATSAIATAEKVETKQITAADNWTHTFRNLRKYTDNGISEYVYSVKETKVGSRDVVDNKAGAYIVSVEGNVITNTLTTEPEELYTSLTVTKIWKNVKGDNIPSMEIQLLRNGEVYREALVTRDSLDASAKADTTDGEEWTYTFTNLPRYSDGIIPYEYTVKEAYVGGVAVENGKAGDYSVVTDTADNKITNTLTGTVEKLNVQKIWKDKAEEANRPTTIKVAVVRKIEGGEWEKPYGTDTLTKDNQWKATFNNGGNGYPKYDTEGNLYTYKVVEVDSEGNWIADGDTITYGNNQYRVNESTDSNGTHIITNTLIGEYVKETETAIKVTKNWLDDNNSQGARPTEITVKLYREGVAQTLEELKVTVANVVTSESNSWTKAFTQTYPMYDEEGALIKYYVEEDAIANYTLKESKGNAKDGFELTNVYTPGLKSITINKVWVDNNNELGKRPSERLTLNLLQNGSEYRHVVLNASVASTWTATQDVPIADENGKLYVYTIEEPQGAVDAEYTATYSDDKLTVTNTLKGELQVSGTKKWDKIAEEYRPESVTVELWRKTKGSAEVQMKDSADKALSITTDASKEWKYDFGKLPKYDESGALYEYIVKEVLIGGTSYEDSDYVATPDADSYDITNAIKESTKTEIVVKGIKKWTDDDDRFVMRPESITINILCDGKKVDSVVVKADKDGAWTYEFKDLPKYDSETGKPLTYSVEEEPVKGYNVTVNGYDIFNVLDENQIPEVKLVLEKTQSVNGGKATADMTEVKAGDEVVYTIKVTNKGTHVVKDIVITDEVPTGLILKANTIAGDGTAKDGVITWTIDSLAVGESVTVSFKVTVPEVKTETTWKNVATATCGNDPTESEEPSNEVVIIEKEASPDTSDHAPITMWTSFMLVSALACGSILVERKRKRI